MSTALVFGSVGAYIYWDQRTFACNGSLLGNAISSSSNVVQIYFHFLRLNTDSMNNNLLVERKQAEMEERIQRNKLESEQRDRARREAAAAAAATTSGALKNNDVGSASDLITPCPPMPRRPSPFYFSINLPNAIWITEIFNQSIYI